MTLLRGLLELFWIQAGIVLFGILTVYLSFQKQRVVRLRPLQLPGGEGDPPPTEGRSDRDLRALGFRWIGDYDASSMDGVVALTRFYATADRVHYAMIAHVGCGEHRCSLLEFSTELSPRGNVSTSNLSQPNTYSYRTEKLVVRAPWKRKAADLFALHRELCEAAGLSGFQPRPVSPADWTTQVADESRLDIEGEVARGRMCRIGPDTYRTTFLGALLSTPKIWVHMTYRVFFAWYRAPDRRLVLRAQERFSRAMRESGLPAAAVQ